MPLRKAIPRTFTPAGLSDTLAEESGFPGSCSILQNLMPDPSSKNMWIARPGAVQLTNFGGFSSPGVISCLTVIGNRAYGMIATSRNPGQDEPFSFNLVSSTFDTVTGVTGANTPTTPSSSGTWTPPTMALCGQRLVITHPGFTGANGFFGVLDLSTVTSPAWSSTNTTGTALPSVPVSVATYMDRSWFAVNPTNTLSATYFTDTASLNLTAGTQVITYGDNTPIVALHGLPYTNVLGGIVQSLLVFKGTVNGVYNIYQVTGDASQTYSTNITVGTTTSTILQSTLQVNSLNIATSTQGPNSIAATPQGILFVSPDGVRLIGWNGQVQPEPIGSNGTGVNAPFLSIATPSRVAAAATSAVYRVSFQNPLVLNTPYQEFWYDLVRKQWSGPHTFPSRLISAWNNTFILAPQAVNGTLWRSDPFQSAVSVYTENGAQLTFELRSSMLDDGGRMAECAITETTLDISLPTGSGATVSVYDENLSLLDQFMIPPTGAASLWGTMVWGTSLWSGALSGFRPRRIDWHQPVVYRRLFVDVMGNCATSLRIGRCYYREQTLGYTQQSA